MNKVLAGCVAGLIATVPMTAAMVAMHRRLPRKEQNALPPYEITKETTEKLGIDKYLDEEGRRGLTMVAHFGYGAASGGVYSLIEEQVPLPSALKGTVYGLFLWGASYLGGLPALDLYRRPDHEPPRRFAMTIAAHVVWGSVLGMLHDRLTSREG